MTALSLRHIGADVLYFCLLRESVSGDSISGDSAGIPADALLEAAGTSAEEVAKSWNAAQQFVAELPGKLFRFGIRAAVAILLFLLGSWLIGLLRRLVKRSMLRARADEGLMHFTDSLIKVALYVLLVIWIASYFGFETTSLVAVIGSAGVTIALALQGSLSNITGGALLLLLKPFKVGDYIREDSKGNEGTVTEIGLFYTKLLTIDEKTVILPNGTLANTSLTNVNLSPARTLVALYGIAYDADLPKAKRLLQETLEENPLVLRDKPIKVYVEALEESQITLGVRVHVKNEDYFELKWGLTEEVKRLFDANGIGIPYPQVDVHMKQG